MTEDPQEKSLSEEIRPLVERLYSEMGRLSYYKILGVGQGASPSAIQQAFYRRAVQLHPDRHHSLEDTDLKTKISKVYKRISESYRVLSSTRMRRLYDRGLRRGELRLGQQDNQNDVPSPHPSPPATDPKIKGLLEKATTLLKNRSFNGAIDLLQKALETHPDSAILQQKIKDARRLKRLWRGNV